MPAYSRAVQFPVWGRLLAERPRRRWEWRLLPFVSSAAIRLLLANGCRSKSGERGQRVRLPRRGLRYDAGLRGEGEIHPDSVARPALRSFLVRGWSSHFPRAKPLSPLNSCLNWSRLALGLFFDSRRITPSV